MFKNENYIIIQGWMRNVLKLKGNELLLYAMIYGFSQDGESEFNGTISYMADWLGVSKPTIHSALKSLCEKRLIIKKETLNNGVKFCSYRFNGELSFFTGGGKEFLYGGSKESLHNDNNNIDNDIIYHEKESTNSTIRMVVNYLNDVCHTNYRANNKETQKHINARLRDGYVLQDFYTVIDKKASEWIGTEFEKYLRPKTLFGAKFEGYLNAKVNSGNPFMDMLKGAAQ